MAMTEIRERAAADFTSATTSEAALASANTPDGVAAPETDITQASEPAQDTFAIKPADQAGNTVTYFSGLDLALRGGGNPHDTLILQGGKFTVSKDLLTSDLEQKLFFNVYGPLTSGQSPTDALSKSQLSVNSPFFPTGKATLIPDGNTGIGNHNQAYRINLADAFFNSPFPAFGDYDFSITAANNQTVFSGTLSSQQNLG